MRSITSANSSRISSPAARWSSTKTPSYLGRDTPLKAASATAAAGASYGGSHPERAPFHVPAPAGDRRRGAGAHWNELPHELPARAPAAAVRRGSDALPRERESGAPRPAHRRSGHRGRVGDGPREPE